MPQSLVLTAIVIGFAMTALFLVILLAARGLTLDVADLFDLRAAFKAAAGFAPDPERVEQFFRAAYHSTFPATQITPGGDIAGIASALAGYLSTRAAVNRVQLAVP